MKSMFSKSLALALGLVLTTSAFAQDASWRDRSGKPQPDTEARRALNGLGGSLVLTPDADWRKKWETPGSTAPNFNEAESVARGQTVTLLIFFSNAKVGADGRADLSCDITLMQPDGGVAVQERDVACYQGELKGGPYKVYRAYPVLEFRAEPGDLAGKWTIEVTLNDKLRKTVLPLKTSFVVQ